MPSVLPSLKSFLMSATQGPPRTATDCASRPALSRAFRTTKRLLTVSLVTHTHVRTSRLKGASAPQAHKRAARTSPRSIRARREDGASCRARVFAPTTASKARAFRIIEAVGTNQRGWFFAANNACLKHMQTVSTCATAAQRADVACGTTEREWTLGESTSSSPW